MRTILSSLFAAAALTTLSPVVFAFHGGSSGGHGMGGGHGSFTHSYHPVSQPHYTPSSNHYSNHSTPKSYVSSHKTYYPSNHTVKSSPNYHSKTYVSKGTQPTAIGKTNHTTSSAWNHKTNTTHLTSIGKTNHANSNTHWTKTNTTHLTSLNNGNHGNHLVLPKGVTNLHTTWNNHTQMGTRSFNYKGHNHNVQFFGRHHGHWSHCCWDSGCCCYCYWEPSCCCWCYWYQPWDCFLPCDCMSMMPPQAVDPDPNVGETGPTDTGTNDLATPGGCGPAFPISGDTLPGLPADPYNANS
jgi:hypothetical protein